MYKFGQIEIASKEFNSIYEVQKDVDCEKIRISKGVVANKHDMRYTLGMRLSLVSLCRSMLRLQKTVYLRESLATTKLHHGRWVSTLAKRSLGERL